MLSITNEISLVTRTIFSAQALIVKYWRDHESLQSIFAMSTLKMSNDNPLAILANQIQIINVSTNMEFSQSTLQVTARPNSFQIEQPVHLIKMCIPLNQLRFQLKHLVHCSRNSTQIASSNSAPKLFRQLAQCIVTKVTPTLNQLQFTPSC